MSTKSQQRSRLKRIASLNRSTVLPAASDNMKFITFIGKTDWMECNRNATLLPNNHEWNTLPIPTMVAVLEAFLDEKKSDAMVKHRDKIIECAFIFYTRLNIANNHPDRNVVISFVDNSTPEREQYDYFIVYIHVSPNNKIMREMGAMFAHDKHKHAA